jgi:hypothetical protein
MKLLSQITIRRKDDEAAIQLLQGDLTAIPPEHEVDILVVSAYPNSYEPYPKTLMEALYNKGVVVREMSKDKEIDLRPQLGCWLSKPLSEEHQKLFNFKQILCFEPGAKVHENSTVVGNIFRCINTFAFEKQNNVIAMPVVASGNQKVPLDKILPAIVEAAIFWFENGLPLKSIKLVLYSDEQAAEGLPHFKKMKQDYESPVLEKQNAGYHPPRQKRSITINTDNVEYERNTGLNAVKGTSFKSMEDLVSERKVYSDIEKGAHLSSSKEGGYDFFISYAHTHSKLIDSFVNQMKKRNNQLEIFYDKDSIPPGGMWIKQISDTIQKSKKVLVFLSPDYNNSPVCWDEFQCAKLLEYNRKTSVIQTIYLYQHEVPLIMGIYSYLDCREGDMDKLLEAIPKLIS